MLGRFRRKFPDRNMAKQCLGWLPVGKTITVRYGVHWMEQVTMTEGGLMFHNLEEQRGI